MGTFWNSIEQALYDFIKWLGRSMISASNRIARLTGMAKLQPFRVLHNPIFLDCQSNPNPSQICDCQSKSKSTFQTGLTIQSKSNRNPANLRKIQ